MVINPELMWRIEHFFTVKNGEPTEFYITSMRLMGTFFLVCAIIMLILNIVKFLM